MDAVAVVVAAAVGVAAAAAVARAAAADVGRPRAAYLFPLTATHWPRLVPTGRIQRTLKP